MGRKTDSSECDTSEPEFLDSLCEAKLLIGVAVDKQNEMSARIVDFALFLLNKYTLILRILWICLTCIAKACQMLVSDEPLGTAGFVLVSDLAESLKACLNTA